jgi:uncharacterized YkwD family protein/spore coat assembly protein SafA
LKKTLKSTIAVCVITIIFTISAVAQSAIYTVKSGDTMWKIASRYQIGVTELIQANKQIKNPALIAPGQKLSIPNIDAVKSLENQVIVLVNKERAKRGLQTLTQNWQLSRVARYKSQDMINKNYFSHTSPTYGSPFVMMEHFGIRFSAAGENIAMGQPTPQSVMTAWMNSPGHRSNILSPAYTQIGVGAAKDSRGVLYWTQQFIKPM